MKNKYQTFSNLYPSAPWKWKIEAKLKHDQKTKIKQKDDEEIINK